MLHYCRQYDMAAIFTAWRGACKQGTCAVIIFCVRLSVCIDVSVSIVVFVSRAAAANGSIMTDPC